MANQLYSRMIGSLLTRRDDDWYPWNYTSPNGHTCDMPRPLTETETVKLAGDFTFYHLSMVITGACALFAILSIVSLMFMHAMHLSRPNEQLNILRICCYIPIFTIGNFLEATWPNAYMYINPWLDFVQAIALCNFFLLMCQFVSPSDDKREHFFAALKVPQKKNRRRRANRRRGRGNAGAEEPVNGLYWYRKMWFLIFQYPVVQFGVAVLTDITEAEKVYCLVSSSPHFGHLWLDLVHNVSLTFALITVLRLYGALKSELGHHRPLAKLLAFKLLVGITGIIQLLYWILRDINPSPLKPTARLSWSDEFIGIPVMILSLCSVPFSIFFHWAYSPRPYYLENATRHKPLVSAETGQYTELSVGSTYQGGPLGIWAWLGMLNPSELIAGLRFGLTMMNEDNRRMGITELQGRNEMGRISDQESSDRTRIGGY